MEKVLKPINIKILATIFLSFLVFTSTALAGPYGEEITIYDGLSQNGIGIGPYNEDNEAEPGMIQKQIWDLEGFFLDGNALSIIGGYNFYQPPVVDNKTIKPGDIFIDIDRDAVFSPDVMSIYDYNSYSIISNDFFKYDYVLDIDWGASTYDIVKLNANSLVQNIMYDETYNKASNPWIYWSGGDVLESALDFEDYGRLSQSNTGFSGWGSNNNHYVATFDLNGIDLSNGALFHNTMECGNDNLLGAVGPYPAPEPTSLIMGGLIGILGFIRRFFKVA